MAHSDIIKKAKKNREDLSKTVNEATPQLPAHLEAKDILSIETVDDELVPVGIQHGDNPFISGVLIFDKLHNRPLHSFRYEIGDILGSGGSGSVYNLLDKNLKRNIAVKFLSASSKDKDKNIKKFMQEALLTSRLEHPNIPPVYNLRMEKNRQIFYTMKKIDGIPLSDIIKDGTGNVQTDIDKIVSIIIKACEALGYAHSRGIIHRDVKPSNIMIGDYGEVYLVDWGVAFDKNDGLEHSGHMAGTPVYMSPEQSKKQTADERSDIYCIGTTLYHALFNEVPFDTSTVDTFWAHKKSGKLRSISVNEKDRIPAPLITICNKCLESKPQDRYQNMEELLSDLKTFQNGGMIRIHQYSMSEIVKFHMKHSVRHIAWVALVCICVVVFSVLLYQQYQRQVADWGEPIFEETFDDPNWKDNWVFREDRSEFVLENGRLVTQNGPEFVWFYKTPIQGDIAIEFEGENLKNSRPGDLSIIFVQDLDEFKTNRTPRNAYYLQHGGLDNTCSMIEGPDGRLDFKLLQLKTNIPYQIRGELDGKNLRLYLDGELICSYELLSPLKGGYIGLYAYHDFKAFDNIKIYNKELPELTTITSPVDMLFENKEYELAIERYKSISEAHAGTDIGNDALYKLGLCYHKLDRADEALKTWKKIDRSQYNNHINHYRWNKLYKNKEYYTLLKQMSDAYKNSPHPKQVIQEWSMFLQDASALGDFELINSFLRFRNAHFPDDQIYSKEVVEALKVIGRIEKALVMFPQQDFVAIQTLLETGRYKDIIDNYPKQEHAQTRALYLSGQFEKLIEREDESEFSILNALIAAGRLDEAEQQFSDDEDFKNRILFYGKGEFQTLIDTLEPEQGYHHTSKLMLGLEEEFLEFIKTRPTVSAERQLDARMSLALRNYVNGDKKDLSELQSLSEGVEGSLYYSRETPFHVYFLLPLLKYFQNDESALFHQLRVIIEKRKQSLGMRLWYCAKLLRGDIGRGEFMRQPQQLRVEADFYLYRALQFDIKGRKQDALHLYKTFKQLPQYKKFPLATINRFIDYRIDALNK